MGADTAIITTAIVTRSPWAGFEIGLASADVANTMVKSHGMQIVAYGILDQEGFFGSLVVDALGYDYYSW